MPKSLDNQLSYSGGEFSPLLDARVDHPKYQQACRQLQNMISLKHGGCTRRPGTLFKAMAKFQDTDVYEYAARLMSFQFSPSTSFMLEFGHQYVRFYSNQEQVVLSAAPAWVSGTAYKKGAFVEDPGDMDNIYYCRADVTSATQPHDDAVSWILQSIYEVPTPYNGRQLISPAGIYEIDVWRIVPCQINDVIYLVHPDYPPQKLERFGDTDWRFSQVGFITPALLDPNATSIYIGPTATTGSITLSANASAWAAATYYNVGQSVNAGVLYTCVIAHVAGTFASDLDNGYWRLETIFTALNVGGVFQMGWVRNSSTVEISLGADGTSAEIEASGDCSFDTYGSWAADVDLERSDDYGVSWYKVRTITSRSDHNGSIPLKVTGTALFRLVVTNYTTSTGTPRAVFTIVDATVYGLVQITAVGSAYGATATVLSKLPSINSTVIWSEGAWSRRRGYPQAVTAFQQRVIYGGSAHEPQRIWGTKTNDIENFDRGDQSLATDSFAFDLAAVGRGRIQWLIGQVDLFCGFSGAEWIINAGQGSFGGSNEPITPTAINAGEHSAWGSAQGIPPALVGNSVLYPQRTGRTLQQMTFSVYTNKYMSQDLTSLSEHLFGAGVAQMAHQPQFRNQSILWVINKAGALIGMTYDMQNEVYSWHRHISGYKESNDTIQFFHSVACIDGQNQQDDEVWVVVDRPNGKMIELIDPENWEKSNESPSKGVAQPDMKQAVYVDSAIIALSPATNTIGGMDHLIGQNVIGLINGNLTFGPIEVNEAGEITIEGYDPQSGDQVNIGLPIYYAVQGMRLDVDGRAGIIIGVTKALSKVFLRVFNSLGGKVVGTGVKQIPINYRPVSLPITEGPQLFTGQKEVVPESTQTDDPKMIVQGNDPLPLTLLAATVRVGITGSA